MFENVWVTGLDLNNSFYWSMENGINNNIVDRLEMCRESMMEYSKDNCHKLRRKIEQACRKIEQVCMHVVERNINYFIAH